jgi:FdhD protein
MNMKKTALRYGPAEVERKGVNVSEEGLFRLFVNKKRVCSMSASPRDLKELAIGFLVSEGILDYSDICQTDVKDNEIRVKTRKGGGGRLQKYPGAVKSRQTFDRDVILNSLSNLDRSSGEWKLTGGTHSASLITCEGEFLCGFEDICRSNALDKVIGWALINSHCLRDKFILFTGRLSSVIVEKMARIGIPLIVSNTAPLSRAMDIAEKFDITLIGFARHPEFNVYSNFWRVSER